MNPEDEGEGGTKSIYLRALRKIREHISSGTGEKQQYKRAPRREARTALLDGGGHCAVAKGGNCCFHFPVAPRKISTTIVRSSSSGPGPGTNQNQ